MIKRAWKDVCKEILITPQEKKPPQDKFLPNQLTMKAISFLISIFILSFSSLSLVAEEVVETGQPLSLEESVDIALRYNRIIHQAQQRIVGAKAGKWEAFSSFLPKLSTASSYTRLDESSTIDITGFPPVAITAEDLYDYNLNLQQPLFTGGRLIALYQQSRQNLRATEYNFEKTKQDLIMQTKLAYFSVLELEKLRRVSEEQVAQIESHLKVVEDLYKVGMVARVDLLTAAVQLAQAKQKLIETENGLDITKATFNNILGREMEEKVNLIDVLDYRPKSQGDLNTYIEKALSERPELAELKANLSIAEGGIKITMSSYLPTLTLVGNLDRKKGSQTPVDEWEDSWNAVIGVNMDIWDWGKRRSQVVQARSKVEELRDSLVLLENAVKLEVIQAYLALRASRDRIGVAKTAVEQAEENFRVNQSRFKEGVATNTEVLDAQTLLTQVKTNYFKALYDYHIAQATLDRAVGAERGDEDERS